MEISLTLIVLFGITWVALLVGLIVACVKLVDYYKEQKKLLYAYELGLKKMEERKNKYKQKVYNLSADYLNSELLRVSLELEIEELKNQKMRAWDVPDKM